MKLDLKAGLWEIPAARTKSKRAHLVHLAPQAVAILEAIKPTIGTKRHMFASPLKPKQARYGRSVNNALLLLFNRGKLPNVTPGHVHDLRRTLITRLADLAYDPFLGHKIAKHLLSGVFAHYNHKTDEEQREAALKAWVARIESLVQSANAVQLHHLAS